MRPHIAAVYAFARAADDFADEEERPADERLALLDEWRRGCFTRPPASSMALFRTWAARSACPARPRRSSPRSARTIRACGLPVSAFDDLLDAFRQDVTDQTLRDLE